MGQLCFGSNWTQNLSFDPYKLHNWWGWYKYEKTNIPFKTIFYYNVWQTFLS